LEHLSARFQCRCPGNRLDRRPNGAKKTIAWVPTLAPEDLTPNDVDPFTRYGAVHIQRALSLVPDSVIGFFDLDIALYLPQDAIRDFDTEYRAISHAQLEFIAAKASSINGCYYWAASHAALLRASGDHAGAEFDLEGIVDGAIDSGVPQGELLKEFVEAALGNDVERLRHARDAVGATLGPDALVDTAGAVAFFNAVVKVAGQVAEGSSLSKTLLSH
jgi:AhpD family alkylhydroperoxidase